MWPEYIHHITVHFPIVMSLVLSALGIWFLFDEAPQLRNFIRWAGWLTFAITTVAVVSGIISAPGLFGGEGPTEVTDHRYLGITAWVTMAIATLAFEYGVREDETRVRKFGGLVWIAVAFGVIGTAHWGGSVVHSDKVPWQGTPPVIDTIDR